MPRKERVEFPGAVYHVISRGNYRKELFESEGGGESFEATLFEATRRCGWTLHAYVIMSNHYHLVVETPEPNLVAGMKWLQSTFATRFNRFRGERGHVFQGRYKALIVGEDRFLAALVDYVHLNPVRAGLMTVDLLRDYALSSYPKFWMRKVADGLTRSVFLSQLGYPDSLAGMARYRTHLKESESGMPAKSGELGRRYCRGWFIGSSADRKTMANDLAERYAEAEWTGVDLKEINEARWEGLVVKALRQMGKRERDLELERKGAPWKARIARHLRRETPASNPWIAKRLKMGHPSRISNLLREDSKHNV